MFVIVVVVDAKHHFDAAAINVADFIQPPGGSDRRGLLVGDDDDEVMFNVLRCQLTYQGQAETSAEAWFNIALRPRKPEGSLGRTAQDGHLDSHTAPEL